MLLAENNKVQIPHHAIRKDIASMLVELEKLEGKNIALKMIIKIYKHFSSIYFYFVINKLRLNLID